MSTRHLAIVLLAGAEAALAPACSSTATSASGASVHFTLPATIPAGGEAWRCQFVRMPHVDAGGETFVGGGESDLSPGTHHFLVYRTSLTDLPPELSAPADCSEHGAMQYTRGWVTGGQLPHEGADFPDGAALPFKSDEVLLVQGHFLNASQKPMDASVAVTFHTVTKEAVKHRAGVLQYYNPYIYLAARAEGSAPMRCPIPHDITLVSAGAHMHKDGVGYEAFIDVAGSPPTAAPFYTTTDGLHPKPWIGKQEIPAGSHIRYRCIYKNVHDHEVTQGPSADEDEMCMFGGFYYPAMAPEEEECFGQDMHGSGAASCSDTTACLASCPLDSRPNFPSGSLKVGTCWQKCIADSCPNVTQSLFPQLACTNQKCSAACADALSDACVACVSSQCAGEWNACQSLPCGPG